MEGNRYKITEDNAAAGMVAEPTPTVRPSLSVQEIRHCLVDAIWFFQMSTCKIMNIQDKIAALEAEIAAATARIAKANAEASKRKAEEYSNRASKVEAEVLKRISAPNFPEAEKQRILAKLQASRSI